MKYFHLKLKPTYFRYVGNIWSTYAQNLLSQNCTIKICWLGKDLPWPKYGAVHKPNIIGPKLFFQYYPELPIWPKIENPYRKLG